ncbi:alpha/beta hydrolase [Fusobacteria bacterium ZRK30]|nr:alpha/beta hydrolase [Fusobacteria bacterium ZRK30]
MKKIILVVFMLVSVLGFSKDNSLNNEEMTVGSRKIPLSEDVSDEFRAYLAAKPIVDIDLIKNMNFETDEEWNQWIQQRDNATIAAVRELAEKLSVNYISDTINGVKVFRVFPSKISREHKSHLFVHNHGGAYILNGGEAALFEAILIADRLKMPVISIDYRMPPSHPAPAGVEDITAVWKELLKDRDPMEMAMGGTSAGGAITAGAIHKLNDLSLPLPGALFIGTPGINMENTGDSRFINEGIDTNLWTWEGIVENALNMYTQNIDSRHPYVSPIEGELNNFPPTYLISGTRDLLLSDTVRMHRKLRRAGVKADLHIYEGQAHADYIAATFSPESYEHFRELDSFLIEHLKK